MVLFGGNTSYAPQSYLRDTWTFTPGARGTYATYGTGCPGSGGTPSLGSRLGEVPIAGQTFHAQVTGLPLVGPAYLFVGASRTQWGLVSLPFDLSSIGMQGCTLLASGDFLFPVTTVLGSGLCSFDVPLSLAGQSFYNQVIAFDPAANPTGLTVSNGAEAFVGN
ncbi:MAG: hypothetical protein HZB39_03185 [Planctomycetes bacterium]|nr:hypothetical protein [Planctomycetota bacterium]